MTEVPGSKKQKGTSLVMGGANEKVWGRDSETFTLRAWREADLEIAWTLRGLPDTKRNKLRKQPCILLLLVINLRMEVIQDGSCKICFCSVFAPQPFCFILSAQFLSFTASPSPVEISACSDVADLGCSSPIHTLRLSWPGFQRSTSDHLLATLIGIAFCYPKLNLSETKLFCLYSSPHVL